MTCPLCRATDLLKTHIPAQLQAEDNVFELKLDEIEVEEEKEEEKVEALGVLGKFSSNHKKY